MLKIGIRGQTFSGRQIMTHFERVPGSTEPQVRITTDHEQIYLPENLFVQMIVELFGSGETIEYRHAKRETR